MINIDNIDTQILKSLEEDGRIPYAVVAKKVGLTSTAVSQRVRKMIDEGIIIDFSVKLNREKLGVNIQAIISLKLNFTKMDAFYRVLSEYDEVEYCYRVTGEDCIIMKSNFKDNSHLLDFINKISVYGMSKTNIIIQQII